MYELFYGLHSKPFQLNPDPAFYFGSSQHRRAKAYLDYGVLRNEGFIVITGEIGAGKTTIVRGLLDSLNAEKVVAAQLVSTQLDAEDTLRMVAAAFGVRSTNVSKADLLMALEVFFVSQAGQGKRCLLVVDEAQNLSRRAVEELRMLSNFQFGNQALLQTFLVGQPEFRGVLQHPQMRQLRQRVVAACHIGPLDNQETQEYVEHRMRVSGGSGRPVFSGNTYESIFRVSGGIPRRINSVCDRLLLLGFLRSREELTSDDVAEVEKEIHDEDGGQQAALQNHTEERGGPLMSQCTPSTVGAIADFASDGETGATCLQRLEQTVLRLEKVNVEILSEIKQIAGGVHMRAEAGSRRK